MSQIQMPQNGLDQSPDSGGGDPSKNWMAITAISLGGANLLSWLCPLCGFPMGIAGIIFGVLGLKSRQRILAIVGIALSSLSILLTIGNAALGVYLQLRNK